MSPGSLNIFTIPRSSVEVVFLLEFLDTPAAVGELLLTGKERMACRAYIKPHLRLERPGHKSVSACASYFTVHIFGMDSFLHAYTFFLAASDNLNLNA